MNSISLRINMLIDELFEGNNSKFAQKIGINEANVRNYRKGTLPKIDFIVKIYENIEFNFDWLLTGKGEMLCSNDAKALHSHPELVEKIEKIQKELDFKTEQVNFYKEKSIDLEKKLEDCENEKKHIKTIS